MSARGKSWASGKKKFALGKFGKKLKDKRKQPEIRIIQSSLKPHQKESLKRCN